MNLSPELTQWLMYFAIAIGGYLLRHWFPNLPFPSPMPGPQPPAPAPTPAPSPMQPILPVSLLDNPKALEFLRELLHAPPPSSTPAQPKV